ncbi:MAG TPA: hypothetical protein VMS98_18480 [Thermoanaerobaculia bacterium]|nr:hypothetical protein [Thermoanaerobaculia bacterium]
MRRALLLFAVVALLLTLPGMLPGRRLVPADIPRDLLAWKGDPSIRVRVSNSLLSDVPLQLIPWDVESRRLIARGEMPWRNRFAGTGGHLFANPLSGLLSPFTWPRLLFGLRGWAWTVWLKLIVAGMSAWWLARVLSPRDTRAAPLVSGLIYALSGFSIVWALYPHTNVFVVLPALAASAIQLAERPTARRVVVAALIAALATAGGHPEGLFVGVGAIFIYLLATRRPAIPFAAASLSGFLLIGVQLVPFALIMADSHVVRARSEMLETRFRKLTPFSLILPGYLGSPLRGELDLTGPVAFAENFNQRTGGFIGAIALLAIVLAFRSLNADMRRALFIAASALVLALAIPGIAHVVSFIPLMQWVAFEYFQVAFVLFATVAAGTALLHVARGPARRRLAIAIAVAALLLLIAGIAPAVAPRQLEGIARDGVARLQQSGYLNQPAAVYESRLTHYIDAARATALRRAALPALCWLLAAAALAMTASRRREILLSTAAVAELLVFGFGYNPAIRLDEIARQPAMIADVKARDPEGRWLIAASNEVFPPNLGTTFAVPHVHSYDILNGEEETQQLLPAGYDPRRWALPLHPSPDQARFLASRGVRFYLTPGGLLDLQASGLGPQASGERQNLPPKGLVAGGFVSIAGLMLLILVARRAGNSRGPTKA